jgi:hypothetical protein
MLAGIWGLTATWRTPESAGAVIHHTVVWASMLAAALWSYWLLLSSGAHDGVTAVTRYGLSGFFLHLAERCIWFVRE